MSTPQTLTHPACPPDRDTDTSRLATEPSPIPTEFVRNNFKLLSESPSAASVLVSHSEYAIQTLLRPIYPRDSIASPRPKNENKPREWWDEIPEVSTKLLRNHSTTPAPLRSCDTPEDEFTSSDSVADVRGFKRDHDESQQGQTGTRLSSVTLATPSLRRRCLD